VTKDGYRIFQTALDALFGRDPVLKHWAIFTGSAGRSGDEFLKVHGTIAGNQRRIVNGAFLPARSHERGYLSFDVAHTWQVGLHRREVSFGGNYRREKSCFRGGIFWAS
jgi:hypothetical protein